MYEGYDPFSNASSGEKESEKKEMEKENRVKRDRTSMRERLSYQYEGRIANFVFLTEVNRLN